MANSYHMEALRKQRLLDRKNEALRRLERQGTDLTKDAVMDGYLSKQTPKESPLITDEGQFNQQRCHLPMFRVNEEGLKNRYRNRQELAPHCDKAFALLYRGNDNSDYTCDVNQNNRRMNIIQNHESLLAKNLRKGFDFSQNRKHRLENESIPNLPPPTILAIQRDHVYKIFHPYDFHS